MVSRINLDNFLHNFWLSSTLLLIIFCITFDHFLQQLKLPSLFSNALLENLVWPEENIVLMAALQVQVLDIPPLLTSRPKTENIYMHIWYLTALPFFALMGGFPLYHCCGVTSAFGSISKYTVHSILWQNWSTCSVKINIFYCKLRICLTWCKT